MTHSPAYGLGDGKDLAHRGFQSFIDLLNTYKPKYFIHGHQHLNYGFNQKRIDFYNGTTIINAFNYFIVEYKSEG